MLPFLPQEEVVERTEAQIIAAKKRSAVFRLMRAVEVTMVDNTQVMKISVTTESAPLSAEIADTIADVYIENYLQAKLDMTAKATSFLTESLEGLKDKLDIAEKNLSQFYERNQVVNIDGVVGLAADELERLSTQLLDAQTALKLNAVIYRQTRNNVTLDDIARLPEVLNHPTIQGCVATKLKP
jgi:succinoglycan biosynthesis transport protein ExoP